MDKLVTLLDYIDKNKDRAEKHLHSVFNIDDMTDDTIFYLLVFCILVPGGKATKARLATLELKTKQYYYRNIDGLILYDILKPLVRFPNEKVKRLIKLKTNNKLIFDIKYGIKNKISNVEHRKYLVESVEGLGYKAASHFLRNLGAKDLAIIDTHILKYVQFFTPSDLNIKLPLNKTTYLKVEEHFKHWANVCDVDPNLLDWLIWCLESNNDVESFSC